MTTTPPDPASTRALAAFRSRFGRNPTWGGSAPGRVNLIGEHTDYNSGFVLPIAIERRCVCFARPAADERATRLFSRDTHETPPFEMDLRGGVDPGIVARGSWPSYVVGVLALMGLRENIDAAIASDVPLGSGLSSSAALEVAVATMIQSKAAAQQVDRTRDLTVHNPSIVAMCRQAEHEYAGVPCGIMDQMISVMGRKDHAMLIDCESEVERFVPMPSEERAAVVVMNTGVRHALASGEYANRRAACQRAAAKMGVASLRRANAATLALQSTSHQAMSEEERACARHVVSENARTLAAAEALQNAELELFGILMNESHESLRRDFKVSCAELDCVVQAAREVDGVFGARMTGAGFGGCAIALAKPDAAAALCRHVNAVFQARFGRVCGVFTTGAGSGAEMIAL